MPYPGFKKNRDVEKPQEESGVRSWRDGVRQEDKPHSKEVDTAGKTETFFSANVKLITAIITLSVVLALIGPWSVFQIKKWYEARQAEATEVLITEQALEDLVARGTKLNWVDFDGYTYKVIADEIVYICQYDVEGGNYYLWVTAPAKGSTVESVLLIDVQNGYEETELKTVE